MPYGANFFDSSGGLMVSYLDRLVRFHSSHSYSGLLTASQTVSVSGMVNDTSWIVFLSAPFHVLVVNTGSFTVQRPPFLPSQFIPDSGVAYVFRA